MWDTLALIVMVWLALSFIEGVFSSPKSVKTLDGRISLLEKRIYELESNFNRLKDPNEKKPKID
ncbi:MAG: hypothetical protein ABII80_01865 [bacterium]